MLRPQHGGLRVLDHEDAHVLDGAGGGVQV